MYGLTEAFRSTYLDPAEVDRRPDSIGKAIPNAEILVAARRRHAVRPGRGGRTRAPRRAGRARLLERPRAHRGAVPPAPAPRSRQAPEMAVWSGDRVVATRRASSTSSAASDEMIKTSGYRVSPTEIEEVAYDTGLVRDAVALGVPTTRPRSARSCSWSRPASGRSTPTRCWRSCAATLPLYMVPQPRSSVRDRAAAIAQRQVRPGRSAQRSCDAHERAHGPPDRRVRPGRRSTGRRRHRRSSGSPPGSARPRSSPTTAH